MYYDGLKDTVRRYSYVYCCFDWLTHSTTKMVVDVKKSIRILNSMQEVVFCKREEYDSSRAHVLIVRILSKTACSLVCEGKQLTALVSHNLPQLQFWHKTDHRTSRETRTFKTYTPKIHTKSAFFFLISLLLLRYSYVRLRFLYFSSCHIHLLFACFYFFKQQFQKKCQAISITMTDGFGSPLHRCATCFLRYCCPLAMDIQQRRRPTPIGPRPAEGTELSGLLSWKCRRRQPSKLARCESRIWRSHGSAWWLLKDAVRSFRSDMKTARRSGLGQRRKCESSSSGHPQSEGQAAIGDIPYLCCRCMKESRWLIHLMRNSLR